MLPFEFDFGPPNPIPPYDLYHDIHLTFGSSDFEPVKTMTKKRVPPSSVVEEQSLESDQTRKSRELTNINDSVDPTNAADFLLLARNEESEAGRMIFFPPANDTEREKAPVSLEHPTLNRPVASFEVAVQLHFLAAAAAFVDEREPVKARQKAKNVIDAVTVPLPPSPILQATSVDGVQDDGPLMMALTPMPADVEVREAEKINSADPEEMTLPHSPSMESFTLPTTPLIHLHSPIV